MKTFLNNFSNPQRPPTKGMKEFDKKKGENCAAERANITALFLAKIFNFGRGPHSAKRGVLNCSVFDSKS